VLASALAPLPFVGRDFFPTVDAGQFRLHVRAAPGTRIESTERLFEQVNDEIRRAIPPEELSGILDNIGLNLVNTFNLGLGDASTISTFDGEILVSLKPGHQPTANYVEILRERLPQRFPGAEFYFKPPDIVNQILNFGLAAPINVQVIGFDREGNYRIAKLIEERLKLVPGAVDVRLHQITAAPDLRINVDRTRAAELGLTQQEVANNLLVSLSSSAQVAPSYWVDPKLGIPYIVAVQTPQRAVNSIDALKNTPVATAGANNGNSPQLLNNLATVERRTAPAVASHFNAQPVFDVYANVHDRDLGSVSSDLEKIVAEFTPKLSPGSSIVIRGQVESMNSAFTSLAWGLLFAAILIYLLMVVNFQSWLDPLIIVTALPGALCGIVWMLFITHTTFSVPALMGAIMSVGVATANSILFVTFANERRDAGLSATQAAISAGSTRLRPILMTALAMIVGMIPMALGFGEGGEQNAPLGRAVIGGLVMATASTLFIVPAVYSLLKKDGRKKEAEDF
jgi:multidrug efflux pump subunit AcrB